MEQSAGVGQFWTPIMAVGGSLLHADLHQICFSVSRSAPKAKRASFNLIFYCNYEVFNFALS